MTDYTDLIARLRGLSSAARNPLIVADPLEHAADEALAAIAALQADIAALHKRQHEVECLATERLRENVALTAERDALRDDVKAFLPMWAVEYARRYGLPDSHLHPQHYDRMAEIGCRMDDFTRAALTSPPQKA